MFERFFPDEYLDSAYVVNYKKLYQEGYRGLLFDVDNTLVPHGAPADPEAVRLFQQLRDIGFSCCLVSNNRKKRVEPFAASVGAQFIEMAAKPSRKGYERAMERLGTNTGNTVFIGDQLWKAKFTINKKIVEYKIHKYCSNSRLHRLNSLSAFAKGTGVCLTDHKWRQSNKHDPQILHSISARSLQRSCTSFAFQIHADQVFS